MFKFTELIPGPDQSPTLQTMATSLSMIAYSFVIVLLVDCTRRLLKADYIQSKWMKPFLFLYLIIMVLLSTLTVVQETVYISKDGKPDSTSRLTGTSQPAVLFGIFDVPISLPFTIWGADIFMVFTSLRLHLMIIPLMWGRLDMEMRHDLSNDASFHSSRSCVCSIYPLPNFLRYSSFHYDSRFVLQPFY